MKKGLILVSILAISCIALGFCIGMGTQENYYEEIIIQETIAKNNQLYNLRYRLTEAERLKEYISQELVVTTENLVVTEGKLTLLLITSEQTQTDYKQLQQDFSEFREGIKTNGYIPIENRMEVVWYLQKTKLALKEYEPTTFDCDDFCLALFKQACIDRRPIGIAWDRDLTHMQNFAIAGDNLYLIEPQNGAVVYVTTLD